MGWEFDGDEDAFNNYCNLNTPSNSKGEYDSNNYDSLHSLFFNKLQENIDINSNYNRLKTASKGIEDILLFIRQSHLFLRYNLNGERIISLQAYNDKIKLSNPALYSKRKKIIEIRRKLLEIREITKYYKLVEDISEDPTYFESITKEDINDIISCRANINSFYLTDVSLRLLFLVSLYNEEYLSYHEECLYNEYSINNLSDSFYEDNLLHPSNKLSEFIARNEGLFANNSMIDALKKLDYSYRFLLNLQGNPNKINDLEVLVLDASSVKIISQNFLIILTVAKNKIQDEVLRIKVKSLDSFQSKIDFEFTSGFNFIPRKYDQEVKKKYADAKLNEQKQNRDSLNIDILLRNGEALLQSPHSTNVKSSNSISKLIQEELLDDILLDSVSTTRFYEIGEVFEINGVSYKVHKSDSDDLFSVVVAYPHEKGLLFNELRRAYNFSRIHYENEGYRCNNLIDTNKFISFVKALIPSEETPLKIEGTFLFNQTLIKIKIDLQGNYYLYPINSDSILYPIDFLNSLPVSENEFIQNVLGYKIESNTIVAKSLYDLDILFNRLKEVFAEIQEYKNKWVKVGDEVNIGNIKLNVCNNGNSKHFFLDSIDHIKNGFIVLDTQRLKLPSSYFDREKFYKEDSGYRGSLSDKLKIKRDCQISLLSSETLQGLTQNIVLLKNAISHANDSNDELIYDLLTIEFKLGKEVEVEFEIEASQSCKLKAINKPERQFNNSNIGRYIDIKRELRKIDVQCLDIAQQYEGRFLGNSIKELYFPDIDNLEGYIKEIKKIYYSKFQNEVSHSIPSDLCILTVNSEIVIHNIKFGVGNNESGFYLRCLSDFSQAKAGEVLSSFIDNDIKEFSLEKLGYYDGGFLPYCRSLLHLSLLVDYIIKCSVL